MHRELYFEFKLFPNFIFNIKYFININNIEIIYLQGHKTSNGDNGLLFIIPKNFYNYNHISHINFEILYQNNKHIFLFFPREYYMFLLDFRSPITPEKINIVLNESQLVVNILLSFVKFYQC